MPLLRMYGVMLACYLIVTSVSVKRYPAFSGLLLIEGGAGGVHDLYGVWSHHLELTLGLDRQVSFTGANRNVRDRRTLHTE